MEKYRVILFAFLFTMYTPMLYFLERNPSLSAFFLVVAVVGAWFIKKTYHRKVEPITDERTELILMKSLSYGFMVFLVGLAFEFIWLASRDQEGALILAKLLIVPMMVSIVSMIVSKEWLERRM
jgi:uncharacterized membrane protein